MAELAEAIFLDAVLRSFCSSVSRSPIVTYHAADSRPGLAATLKSKFIVVGDNPWQESLAKQRTDAKATSKSSPHLMQTKRGHRSVTLGGGCDFVGASSTRIAVIPVYDASVGSPPVTPVSQPETLNTPLPGGIATLLGKTF